MTAELFADEEGAMSNGIALNAWQRAVIAEWHQRHPRPVELVYGSLTVRCVPRGCYCARCGALAVAMPAYESSEDLTDARMRTGHAICPRCSIPKSVHSQ